MTQLSIHSLSYRYSTSCKDIIHNLSMSFSNGITGLIGPNGCGKSTLLALLDQQLAPLSGHVICRAQHISFCGQEINIDLKSCEAFYADYSPHVIRLKDSLGLFNPIENPHELSQGERKRLQLGLCLQHPADILLLDEPTNHLDSISRDYIIQTLLTFEGMCVLVSHDRLLLNKVCDQCVFFEQGEIYSFSGTYDQAKVAFDHYKQAQAHHREENKKKIQKLAKEANRLEQANTNSKQRLSKRHLSKHDHDAKGRIDAARITGKDASLGQQKISIDKRITDLKLELKNIPVYKNHTGSVFFYENTQFRKILIDLPAGQMELPNHTILTFPRLSLTNQQKIGIMGINGVGKSSFLHWLLQTDKIKTVDFFFLPQEYTDLDEKNLKQSLNCLESDKFTQVLHIISRLGSDPKQILASLQLSAGQRRKLAIALAIVRGAQLLILDEPTNHLDLPSIELLEELLKSHCLGVLIVSHDKDFLMQVCDTFWHFEDGKIHLV